MCMAAAVAVSMSACGDSKADQETQETEQTMQTAEQESTDSTPSTEQERVGDREDYVGLQDLEIEDYVTLPDYTDMKVSAARPAVDDGTVEQYIDSELFGRRHPGIRGGTCRCDAWRDGGSGADFSGKL